MSLTRRGFFQQVLGRQSLGWLAGLGVYQLERMTRLLESPPATPDEAGRALQRRRSVPPAAVSPPAGEEKA